MFRDDFAVCPRCNAGLEKARAWLECSQCKGALIDPRALYDTINEAQIQALFAEKRKSPWAREPLAQSLELRDGNHGGEVIECPCCETKMSKHLLYGVEVDRCEAHGVWLDGTHELRQILAAAAARI